MKKSIITALALAAAAPVFAGEAPLAPLPIVTPTPAPAACPISVELAGFYSFANNDIYRHGYGSVKDIDVYGADLTGVYTIDKTHSVNLRFGYSFGDERNAEARNNGVKQEVDVHTFYLMPGYRYTRPLTESLSAYAGVNVGIASLSVKDEWRDADGSYKGHDSDFGFAYSAEVGLRYKVSENCEIFGAYQFVGSSANPRIESDIYDMAQPVRQQTYNSFRVGVSVKF